MVVLAAPVPIPRTPSPSQDPALRHYIHAIHAHASLRLDATSQGYTQHASHRRSLDLRRVVGHATVVQRAQFAMAFIQKDPCVERTRVLLGDDVDPDAVMVDTVTMALVHPIPVNHDDEPWSEDDEDSLCLSTSSCSSDTEIESGSDMEDNDEWSLFVKTITQSHCSNTMDSGDLALHRPESPRFNLPALAY